MFPADDRQRRTLVIWSAISGFVHLLWEGSWSLMAPALQSPAALHDWRIVWTVYGRADSRYLHADPFVRALELFTGTIVAGLNLWAAWSFARRRGERAATLALVTASIMEIYGDCLYFGSEWLDGWSHVDTHSALHLWVMFVGLNVLWFIFPGWCLWEIVQQKPGGPRAQTHASPDMEKAHAT